MANGTLQGYKSRIFEAQQGKIRSQPIGDKLKRVLDAAADKAGVAVRIISGGQPPKGSGGRRTGSTRHDSGNAADLQLVKDGTVLDFRDPAQRAIMENFVSEAAAGGATGIGAGLGYMGGHTLHVGFGNKAVWGQGGKSANAPDWLVAAVNKGWDNLTGGEDAIRQPGETARVLRRGVKGEDVRQLQTVLNQSGYETGPLDGIFGSRTRRAVAAYQADINNARKRAGLDAIAVDGAVGDETRPNLLQLLARQESVQPVPEPNPTQPIAAPLPRPNPMRQPAKDIPQLRSAFRGLRSVLDTPSYGPGDMGTAMPTDPRQLMAKLLIGQAK